MTLLEATLGMTRMVEVFIERGDTESAKLYIKYICDGLEFLIEEEKGGDK